jgi:hypothetical protein
MTNDVISSRWKSPTKELADTMASGSAATRIGDINPLLESVGQASYIRAVPTGHSARLKRESHPLNACLILMFTSLRVRSSYHLDAHSR